MPIDSEQFEKAKEAPQEKQKGHNQQVIMDLLGSKSMAFTQAEIHKATGINLAPSVNSSLHALERQGKVAVKMVEGRLYWSARESVPVEVVPEVISREPEELIPAVVETGPEPIVQARDVEELNEPLVVSTSPKKTSRKKKKKSRRKKKSK